MIPRRFGFALTAAVGLGCAAPQRGEVVEAGVARAQFEVRARGTDLIRTTALFPADDVGAPRGEGLPGVVFVQGGFVSTTRYEWQAIALAKAGYVVVLPEHPLNLAFFAIDSGASARELLLRPPAGSVLDGLVDPGRLAVIGHSLGSGVAVKLALQGGFGAVVMEAGFPDSADTNQLTTFGKPSLSLAGSLDCSARLEAVTKGWGNFPQATALSVLEGVTHYQFTDAEAEDRKSGCLPGVELAVAHARIAESLVVFLSAALADGTVDQRGLQRVAGATVEVR